MINQLKQVLPHSVKMAIKLAVYKGDKYSCPFCGYNARKLAPIGYDFPVLIEKKVVGAGTRNASCYKCGSSDRERLIYIYLKDHLKIFENPKGFHILHMAPEKNLTYALKDKGFGSYICGDLFTEGYSYPAHVQSMDVLNIPFKDKSFDLILCNHLLEHVPNDKKAMSELLRVLKVGGKAILQVPISLNSKETFEDFSITGSAEREVAFGQHNHIRIYGQDYADRLSSAGFKVTRHNISKENALYGLNMKEDIYLVERESK
jgi:SAM-dependent methyltransferase